MYASGNLVDCTTSKVNRLWSMSLIIGFPLRKSSSIYVHTPLWILRYHATRDSCLNLMPVKFHSCRLMLRYINCYAWFSLVGCRKIPQVINLPTSPLRGICPGTLSVLQPQTLQMICGTYLPTRSGQWDQRRFSGQTSSRYRNQANRAPHTTEFFYIF